MLGHTQGHGGVHPLRGDVTLNFGFDSMTIDVFFTDIENLTTNDDYPDFQFDAVPVSDGGIHEPHGKPHTSPVASTDPLPTLTKRSEGVFTYPRRWERSAPGSNSEAPAAPGKGQRWSRQSPKTRARCRGSPARPPENQRLYWSLERPASSPSTSFLNCWRQVIAWSVRYGRHRAGTKSATRCARISPRPPSWTSACASSPWTSARDDGWLDAMSGVDVLMHTASPLPMAQPRDENELVRPAVDGTLRALRGGPRGRYRSRGAHVLDRSRYQRSRQRRHEEIRRVRLERPVVARDHAVHQVEDPGGAGGMGFRGE